MHVRQSVILFNFDETCCIGRTRQLITGSWANGSNGSLFGWVTCRSRVNVRSPMTHVCLFEHIIIIHLWSTDELASQAVSALMWATTPTDSSVDHWKKELLSDGPIRKYAYRHVDRRLVMTLLHSSGLEIMQTLSRYFLTFQEDYWLFEHLRTILRCI